MGVLYKIIKFALLLLCLLVGISFASLNTDQIVIDLWVDTVRLPVSLVIALAVLLGALISTLYFAFPLLKRKGQISYLHGKINRMKPE